jgi:acetyl-CoA carboxylase biotin carboxyl carrier protein
MTEPAEGRETGDPVMPVAEVVEAPAPSDRGDASLLALIDRLSALLQSSDLTELEVEAGETGLVLRKPAALAPAAAAGGAAAGVLGSGASGAAGGARDGHPAPGEPIGGLAETPARPSIKAPLTGIFYASPAPGSAPYVQIGSQIAVGTVIGLIEAMKLFNEIKSDLGGRVVRIVAETGTLVKAKQPLIEVEPL